jgi:CheY-like chemotaxis protein
MRPCYRIAVFGLGHRFQRLLEIIVKHARHNNYRYQVAEHRDKGDFDIALVDLTVAGGVEVARTLKSVPQALPVIGVGRRSNHRRGNDDLLLATFSLDVLGVLNRAAESLSLRERTRQLSSRLVQADPALRLPLISGRPPRALVIEPSPSVRSQLAVALRQIGVDAEGVGTLAQAEDVLSMRRYELMILEPQQPDGDGLAMLRRLRHAPRTAKLKLGMPVIVLSSRSGMLDLAKAAWAGCSGYLGKPVPLSTLHATVNRILAKSLRLHLDQERKIQKRAIALPERVAGPAPAHEPVPVSLFGTGLAMSTPKLEPYLPSPPPRAGTIESALAALQAQSARPAQPLRSLDPIAQLRTLGTTSPRAAQPQGRNLSL